MKALQPRCCDPKHARPKLPSLNESSANGTGSLVAYSTRGSTRDLRRLKPRCRQDDGPEVDHLATTARSKLIHDARLADAVCAPQHDGVASVGQNLNQRS